MATALLEKAPSVEDMLHEASRLKELVTDAVDDGMRSAMRALRHGRDVAEDMVVDTQRTVKKHPLQSISIAFAAGLVAGGVAMWIARRC